MRADLRSLSVQICVVTYNSREVIPALLAGISSLSETNLDVGLVVVDNSSQDDTVDLIRLGLQDLGGWLDYQVIESPTNRGWSGGNNLGLLSIPDSTDYVLLMNPDATIDSTGLERLVATMQDHEAAGLAIPFVWRDGALQISANPELTWMKYFIWDVFGDARRLRRFRQRYARLTKSQVLVDGYASGALALVSYRALLDIGFLDDSMFMFHDDVDLCRSLRRSGYELLIVPGAVGVHSGGVGSRILDAADSDNAVALLSFESELPFVEKWHGTTRARVLAWYRAVVYFRLLSMGRRLRGRAAVETDELAEPARRYLQGNRPERSNL